MNLHIIGPLTIAFLLGVLWRLFARASKAYRSKLRSYPSRWAFIVTNWDVFLLRTFPWNAGLFALWLFHPALLSKGLIFVHVPESVANWIIVTPNLLSSFAFGFMVDYGLDQFQIKLAAMDLPSWFPEALKGEIPQYDQQAVNGAVVAQKNNRDTGLSGSTPKPNGNGAT